MKYVENITIYSRIGWKLVKKGWPDNHVIWMIGPNILHLTDMNFGKF